MLEVKNLYKKFAETVAVDNVSFSLKEGKIVGILGKNGAGKSTIFRIILDILQADKGEVILDGKKYTIKDNIKVGFLPEEGSLSQELTVFEQMSFYGSLKNMSDEEILDSLTKWLICFDIVEYMNRKIKELSKGNRQRIQFIASILHNPSIVILDEPFSGLDPLGVEKFKEILLELKKEGKSIIFSSHRMEHVEVFCDDILLLDKGITLCYGNLREIKESYPKSKVVLEKNDQKQEYIFVNEKAKQYISELKEPDKQFARLEKLSLNDIFIDKVGEADVK